MKKTKLMLGDNIQSLKKLPENSIDSVITDPPYGLSFMNKKWDYDVPSVEFWKEVWRVLKPGGHILSFGGTRTYHRMVLNIEDAGFEIRDQIMWLYGSGFPKSHNIGKAVDKIEGNERVLIKEVKNNRGQSTQNAGFGEYGMGDRNITKGTSEYEGWGTALKPANEPICLARKPLSEKSVAKNVLKWGTGGINIDGCRIEGAYGSGQNEIIEGKEAGQMYHRHEKGMEGNNYKQRIMVSNPEGRFPANIILDETAAELLDEQSGYLKSGEVKPHHKKNKQTWKFYVEETANGQNTDTTLKGYGDGASRFFYIAKVSKTERNMGLDGFKENNETMFGKDGVKQLGRATLPGNEHQQKNIEPKKNSHPTVKPINLMTYLCRLITPKNGIVLDPFMGSGSTGIAALLEGFRFVGMEMDSEYFKIAEARIENWESYREFTEPKKKSSNKIKK